MMIECSEAAQADGQTIIQNTISMADFQSCFKFKFGNIFHAGFSGGLRLALHWFSKMVHGIVPNTLKLIFDILAFFPLDFYCMLYIYVMLS